MQMLNLNEINAVNGGAFGTKKPAGIPSPQDGPMGGMPGPTRPQPEPLDDPVTKGGVPVKAFGF